jgi:hypothetical protein
MNKAKLKVLVMALKEIVEELESEIYSDPESYIDKRENFDDPLPHYGDYDEVFNDDDGYPD